jgi:hypothetical protein
MENHRTMEPSTSCPKCFAVERPGLKACARCGLLVSRWATFSASLPEDPRLDELWRALLADWQDPQRHARFLDEAAGASGLDLAAARYRLAARERPGDPLAEAGLARAAMLAERLHAARAESERPGPQRWLERASVAVATLVLAGAIWILAVVLTHR